MKSYTGKDIMAPLLSPPITKDCIAELFAGRESVTIADILDSSIPYEERLRIVFSLLPNSVVNRLVVDFAVDVLDKCRAMPRQPAISAVAAYGATTAGAAAAKQAAAVYAAAAETALANADSNAATVAASDAIVAAHVADAYRAAAASATAAYATCASKYDPAIVVIHSVYEQAADAERAWQIERIKEVTRNM